MKKGKVLIVASLLIVLSVGMSACSHSSSNSPSSTKVQSKPDNKSQSKTVSKNKNTVDSSKVDDSTNDLPNDSSTTVATTIGDNDIHISSGKEAIHYLKQHIKEGTNDDISFGTGGTLKTDNIGSYYTIALVSISLRVSGKTGTLGHYKVYQDGTYKTFY